MLTVNYKKFYISLDMIKFKRESKVFKLVSFIKGLHRVT